VSTRDAATKFVATGRYDALMDRTADHRDIAAPDAAGGEGTD